MYSVINGLHLRKIDIIDMLEYEHIVPFQIFHQKKESMGIWGKMQKLKKETKEIDEENLNKVLEKILELCVMNEDFNYQDFYVENGIDACLAVFTEIFRISTKLFNKIEYKIKENRALIIDQMCKRYGKSPIEIICNDKSRYNDIDAWLFNNFISQTAITKENKDIQRANQRVKNGR